MIALACSRMQKQPREAPVGRVGCQGCQPQNAALGHLGTEAGLGGVAGSAGIIQHARIAAHAVLSPVGQELAVGVDGRDLRACT